MHLDLGGLEIGDDFFVFVVTCIITEDVDSLSISSRNSQREWLLRSRRRMRGLELLQGTSA
jgi:hypothetical protein